jgi:hypothetical protein
VCIFCERRWERIEPCLVGSTCRLPLLAPARPETAPPVALTISSCTTSLRASFPSAAKECGSRGRTRTGERRVGRCSWLCFPPDPPFSHSTDPHLSTLFARFRGGAKPWPPRLGATGSWPPGLFAAPPERPGSPNSCAMASSRLRAHLAILVPRNRVMDTLLKINFPRQQ